MIIFEKNFTTREEIFEYLTTIDADNLSPEAKIMLITEYSNTSILFEAITGFIRPEKNQYVYTEFLTEYLTVCNLEQIKNCFNHLSPLFDNKLFQLSLVSSSREVIDYLLTVIEVDHAELNIEEVLRYDTTIDQLKIAFSYYKDSLCASDLEYEDSYFYINIEKDRTFEEFLFLINQSEQKNDYAYILRMTNNYDFAIKLYDHYKNENKLTQNIIFEYLQELSTYNNEPAQSFRLDIIDYILNDISKTDFNKIFSTVLTLNCFHLDELLFNKFISIMSSGNRKELFINTFKSLNDNFSNGIDFIPEVEEYDTFKEFYERENETPDLVNHIYKTVVVPKKVAAF
jgi:hypothetical protein